MRKLRRTMSIAAAMLLMGGAQTHAEEPRTGMGPAARPANPIPAEPNPVKSPGRAETSIPGRMEAPDGAKLPSNETGLTESGNARRPAGPAAVP